MTIRVFSFTVLTMRKVVGFIGFLIDRFRDFWIDRPRHKTGSVMFVGNTGSFKTYSAVALALSYRSRIFTNIHIDSPDHDIDYFDEFDQLVGARCGTVLLDEAGLILDSQKWMEYGKEVKQAALEQRKRHWCLIMTAQMPNNVEAHYRNICHSIVYVKAYKVPFLALFFPHSFTNALRCESCDWNIVPANMPFEGTLLAYYEIDWDEWLKFRKLVETPITDKVMDKFMQTHRPVHKRKWFKLYDQRIADRYSSAKEVCTHNFVNTGRQVK